ncbi:hypothetical protein [Ancylobacter defluvii]|uniref:Uncharacterized protein n=1 Tax=Ancylobacter defluvii TaxID=1282440 RepID=A0A9W6NDG2_9HYPH|nr:hypothetical protein [Ancylobacter defluvii]MBS7588241.1 hypothetical protein [Ancylobacter defluvii]GLK86637.1 hypothetical protein GCM10017653_47070 [Ancylobacter defluvii]
MRDALAKLLATNRRLLDIEREAEAARCLPAAYANAIERVSVSGDGYYSRSTPEDIERVKAAQKKLAAEERRRGEIERDEMLRALGLELDAIRATLPGLAAAASIELGAIPRAMMEGRANG